MREKFVFLICLIFILPHCTKKNPKESFTTVSEQSKKRCNTEPMWKEQSNKKEVTSLINKGISIHDAITIGISNNLPLQAKFEEIGVKKSDLIQAGFYTNPNVDCVFRIPKKKDLQTNIELTANFMLSDLWQVPLRKKVAQYDLEVKTYEIVNEILHLRHNIQKNYITCLYHQKRLHLTKEITNLINSYKKRIDYRYKFGYTSDLDKYLAESKLGEWEVNIIDTQKDLQQSYVALREILGGEISIESVALSDMLKTFPDITPLKQLEYFALTSHPTILIEKSKIARANKTISYEKSQIIDNIQLGVSYKRDFEKNVSGVGPSVALDIPLFDTNYGNIERAKFLYEQAKKALVAQKQIILKNVATNYIQYESYLKQIKHYETFVIPPIIKAIAYGKKFFNRMQMTKMVFLETQIDLYKHRLELLELQYKTASAYADLEFSLGSQLNIIS